MDTLRQESTFDDQPFDDLSRNFILSDRFTGLAEFGVRSIHNADIIRLKGLAGPPMHCVKILVVSEAATEMAATPYGHHAFRILAAGP